VDLSLNKEETLSEQILKTSSNNLDVNRQSGKTEQNLRVFVLNMRKEPLMPCSPAKARHLLKYKKAVVVTCKPFTIQLKRATGETKQEITLGIDSGAKFVIICEGDVKLDHQQQIKTSLIDKDEEFHISDLTKLFTNKSFLLITALCVTFYAGVFPFLKFAPDFFFHKYGVSRETSGDIASLLPYGTVIFTPLFGWLVDKKGKSASLMIYGALLLLIVHLLFSFTTFNVYALMVLLGISFSLVPAAMWPAVAKIVPEYRIGTAYGTMFSLQNLGLFGVPIFAGYLLDITNPGVTPQMIEEGSKLYYTPTILMFAVFGVLGVVFALLLKHDDKTSGYGLELPSNASKEE